MLEAGQTLERYALLGPLGAGGMAEVWLVRHTRLGTLHALKVLNSRHPGLLERLVREGQLQGGLAHPGVVSVTDILELEGAPCLVLEYVAGPGLDQLLRRHTLPLPALDALGRDVLDAMAAAHARGWVHRDLKPGNILLDLRGERARPKVADFGLAKGSIEENPSGPRTRMGSTLGTPAYMAPEQVRDSASVDARADVWALGALLYEAACGRQPFRGDDDFDLLASVTSGRRAPVADLAPHLPARMRDAIERALTVDREARFADAGEMRAAWVAGSESDPEPLLESAPLRPYWQPPPDGTSPTAVPAGASALPSNDTTPFTSADPLAPTAGDATVDDGGWRDHEAWRAVDLDAPTEDEPLALEARPSGPRSRPARQDSTLADDAALDAPVGPPAPAGVPAPAPAAVQVPAGISGRRRVAAWVALAAAALVAVAVGVARWVAATSGPQVELAPSVMLIAGELVAEPAPAEPGDGRRYEVTREGGQVTRLRFVTAQGHPSPLWDDIELQELVAIRDPQGAITAWEARAPGGGLVHRATVEREADEVVVRHFGAHGAPQRAPWPLFGLSDVAEASGVLVERFSRLEPGAWRARFETPEGHPSAVNGAFGAELAVDEAGLLISRTPLDVDGRPGVDAQGVGVVRYLREDPRHPAAVTRLRYEAPLGGLVAGPESWAEQVSTYDDQRDLTSLRWFAPSGQPTWGPQGCHELRHDLTRSGLTQTCLEDDGAVVPSKERWAVRVTTYDERGYRTHVATLDPAGDPIATKGGAASWDLAYDDFGRAVRDGPWYDEEGQPVPAPDGVYTTRIVRYDDLGRVVARIWLGPDGKPTAGPLGPAEVRVVLDPHGGMGAMAEEAAFDENGRPSVFSGAVHRRTYTYDRGHMAEESRWDVRGALVAAEDGVARSTWTFDEFGHLASYATFDAALRPTPHEPGSAVARSDETWDEHGRLRGMAWFDVEGSPTAGPNGCVREAFETNAAGWRTRTDCLDAEGHPAVGGLGFSTALSTYDAVGRETSNTYERFDGEPIPGCAREVFEHDLRGRETYLRCYDARGYPAAFDDGSGSVVHNAYDDLDRLTLMELLGTSGQRVVDPDRGFAAVYKSYDGPTERERERWFEGDFGQLVVPPDFGYARGTFTHDALDRLVDERYFGVDREPMFNALVGYSSQRREWTGGKLQRARLFGVDDQPLPPPAGAVGDYTYDDLGRVDAITWTDATGAPALGPDGHHRAQCVRGISGDCLRWARTRVDGTEIPGDDWSPRY